MDQKDSKLNGFSDEVKQQVFIQSYESKAQIEGVVVQELRYFSDDGGFFLEVARLTDSGLFQGFETLNVKQVNYSEVVPGVRKAWHLHPMQNELWFIPPTQKLLVGLLDCRADSLTKGVSMRFVAGAGRAHAIFIPHGVAHGLANLYDKPMHMMYFVSETFDPKPENTQEYRLPWNYLGDNFWEIEKG